ncbi:transforming growth factor-beta-induced protein ig-h3-like [Glandiceps talaboti]
MALMKLFFVHLLVGCVQLAMLNVGGVADAQTDTIYKTAKTLGATEFLAYVDKTPSVKKLLTTGSNFTVFVPDNEAFKTMSKEAKKAMEAPDVVEWVLQYHMGIGIVHAREYAQDLLIPTAFQPPPGEGVSLQSIRINIYEAFRGGHRKVYTASGAAVFKPDYECTNGLIHIVKKVMYPLPTGNNIADFLNVDPRFTMLNQLLKKVNLTAALATDATKPLTVFAPTDAAFTKLTDDQKKRLNDTTYLTDTLKTHVVEGAFYAASFYDFKEFKALTGSTLVLEMGAGGVTIQDKLLTGFDITLTNGVVHVLSEVILPKKDDTENSVPADIY